MRQITIVLLAVVLAGFYSFYNTANVYAGDPTGNIEQSPEDQFNLGLYYYLGLFVPQDYEKAAMWLRKAAEQGNADAQSQLGFMYAKGQGVPQDYAESVKWYRKAADQGDADAQHNLGFMYEQGQGVPQDYAESVKWYRKAAEQGNADGQFNLGEMYANGQGVPQNYAEAVKWYRKAAEQGNAGGQVNLGVMYVNGKGVPQDYAEAAKWFRKAAEQGNADGQFNLGFMYYQGDSVPQNYAEATKWYRKAADQGDAKAQFNLGFMYDNGQGVPQNYILAYAWSNLAAAKGQKQAPKLRDSVAGKMTPAQIAEAQKLSAQLQQEINRPSASPDPKDRSPKTSGIPGRQVKGSGSGFIITKNGYVLTCQHVIDNAQSIEVAIEDNVYPAKLIREDKYNDLALLKISGTFPPLAFSAKRSAQMGQEVFTIGYPNPILQGISAKLTKGTVASLTEASKMI
jgi:TPR repeat protein